MADPVSRVSRVVMRGPLAPFAEEYRSELLARGYTRADRGESAAAGVAAEPLAR